MNSGLFGIPSHFSRPQNIVASALNLTGVFTAVQSKVNTGFVASTGYSLTGTDATSLINLAGTVNTSGAADIIKLAVTVTSGNNAKFLNLLGGAAGTTSNFSVDVFGSVIQAGTLHLPSKAKLGDSAHLSGFAVIGTAQIGWTVSTNPQVALDAILTRGGAAATVQQGAADAAVAVAQTRQVQSVVAGTTDTAGAVSTQVGSKGTGTAASGNLVDKTGFSAKSTGSSQHTTVDRRTIVAKGKVLTDNSAVSLFEIALPTLAMAGGVIEATVVCTDGTDEQSFSQTITYSAVNKGGVYTKSITASAGDKSVSAGTITNTWSILDGTNKVTIQLTSDTSLTPSTNAFLCYYTVKNNSEQATTIL